MKYFPDASVTLLSHKREQRDSYVCVSSLQLFVSAGDAEGDGLFSFLITSREAAPWKLQMEEKNNKDSRRKKLIKRKCD